MADVKLDVTERGAVVHEPQEVLLHIYHGDHVWVPYFGLPTIFWLHGGSKRFYQWLPRRSTCICWWGFPGIGAKRAAIGEG